MKLQLTVVLVIAILSFGITEGRPDEFIDDKMVNVANVTALIMFKYLTDTDNDPTTLSDVEQAIELLSHPGQNRFFTELFLLLFFVNMQPINTNLNGNLKRGDVISLLTTQLLTQDNAPQSSRLHVVELDWYVARPFRVFYWTCQALYPGGDKVFFQLWNNTPNEVKDSIDPESLFNIIDFAVNKNYLAVVKELWNLPTRKEISTSKLILPPVAAGIDNAESRQFIVDQLQKEKYKIEL